MVPLTAVPEAEKKKKRVTAQRAPSGRKSSALYTGELPDRNPAAAGG